MNGPDAVLDERIRRHYESAALEPRELAQLRAGMDAEELAVPGQRRVGDRRRALTVGLAIAAVTLVAVGLAIHAIWPRQIPSSWNGEAVAAEIGQHHLQNRDPEFRSDTVAGLATAMASHLGFAPADPALLRTEGLTVEGGRYCAIATFAAAQIRLRDASGRHCTLYEFRAATSPAPMSEEHFVGGVRVRLWRDGDLVFGLAQPR